MKLSDAEYRNIIDYLEMHTTYDIGLLAAKDDAQLYNMKKRIEECMHKYPKEIADYYRAHPEVTPRYSLEELKKMKYNELGKIRKSLKIRGSKKKVTKTEPAGHVADRARQTIQDTPTNQVVANIIESNNEHEERDFEFITYKEAIQMYGPDISVEYLEREGFKLYDESDQVRDYDVDKIYLIDAIEQLGISIKGMTLTTEYLLTLNIQELETLYTMASTIAEELENGKRLKF